MGHDMPIQLMPTFADAMMAAVSRATGEEDKPGRALPLISPALVATITALFGDRGQFVGKSPRAAKAADRGYQHNETKILVLTHITG
jgi:hypothetical protein